MPAQDLPHEGAAALYGHLAVDFQRIDRLYQRHDHLRQPEHRHQDDERHQQLPVLPRQQTVHEEAREHRVDDPEQIADDRGKQYERDGCTGTGQPLFCKFQRAFLFSARLEVRPRRDLQADARKRLVKLLHRDLDLASGRVVDVGVFPLESVQNHKVVEVPVDDGGIADILLQGMQLAAEALRLKAVVSCREQHVSRVGPVPGHAAVKPDLFQRDPEAVIGHNHGKGSRPAFQCFHLHDHRNLGSSLYNRFFNFFLTHQPALKDMPQSPAGKRRIA